MTKRNAFLFTILLALTGITTHARATETVAFDAAKFQARAMVAAHVDGELNWKVGDRASFTIDMSITKGTAEQFVREETATSFWVQTDIELQRFGKQKIEVLTNKTTGAIEQLLVNGRAQTPPDPSTLEVVETRNDHIRVAAGEFDCVYAKIRNTKDNSIEESWSNDTAVPMGGILKDIATAQVGNVTQELVSFSFKPR